MLKCLRSLQGLLDRKVLRDVQSVLLCGLIVRWSDSGKKLRKVANCRKSREIDTLSGEKYI